MARGTNQYRPDYAVAPGWVLEERLEAHGISHAEFARRCGRSPKLISEIISGKAPIEPKTALQFEKVLGVDASVWLGMETDYRLRQTREAERQDTEEYTAWSKTFPVNELWKRGVISKPSSAGETVSELLSFFGVASIKAWQTKYSTVNVAYRHSPSFESDEASLASWLRLAEMNAEDQTTGTYVESAFKTALGQIRGLTRTPVPETLEQTRKLCNQAGVAFSPVEPLSKTRLSGAAWWRSPRKPIIALSARHKTDDHLWFSLFHEAAHILLHSKKNVFVDETDGDGDDVEAEANDWAAKFLIPPSDWKSFVAAGAYGRADIVQFADEQGIAPGIIVGRLQHEKLLAWNRLNELKVRLRWTNDR